jgi:hypothetical protein
MKNVFKNKKLKLLNFSKYKSINTKTYKKGKEFIRNEKKNTGNEKNLYFLKFQAKKNKKYPIV